MRHHAPYQQQSVEETEGAHITERVQGNLNIQGVMSNGEERQSTDRRPDKTFEMFKDMDKH